jgi:hypothetical protein
MKYAERAKPALLFAIAGGGIGPAICPMQLAAALQSYRSVQEGGVGTDPRRRRRRRPMSVHTCSHESPMAVGRGSKSLRAMRCLKNTSQSAGRK